MRRPDDLVTFLNQYDYRQVITGINAQLLGLQMEITDKVQHSTFFQVEIMSHTECIIYYSLKQDDLYSTLKDRKYMYRINTKRMITKSDGDSKRLEYPLCDAVPFSLSCFEHLNSMINRKRLQMLPEITLHTEDIGVMKDNFVKMISFGLKQEPLSWKYPLLASYYWRGKGNARRATDCARRAIYLAPRKFVDIPLLSLGTIFQRSNKTQDALIVMQAAHHHAPDIYENLIGLGNARFLMSDFGGAIKVYREAANMDPGQFKDRLDYLEKSVSCFKNIKSKLREFRRQVQEIFGLLDNYKRNQTQLEDYLSRVLSEQVPIGTRLSDESFGVYAEYFLQRRQYCRPKEVPDSKDPILFCDFYSDLQSQLDKEDLIVDIVHHFADAAPKFVDNFSLGVYQHLTVEDFLEADADYVNGRNTINSYDSEYPSTTSETASVESTNHLNVENLVDVKQYEIL